MVYWIKRIFHALTALTITSNVQVAMATGVTISGRPVRLLGVQGHDDRKNDIIYCQKLLDGPLHSRVIFFGGDTQDYPENMKSHRDNHRYLKWNLVSVADLLSHQFPTSDVFVIKPKRMQLKTFSCYDNFVKANEMGAPTHVPNYAAFEHLTGLLTNMLQRNALKSDEHSAASIDTVPLVIIGFSKGCVVLNQLLYEMHFNQDKSEVVNVVSNIKDMYWLDGGHTGGSETWITKQEILKHLAASGIKVHVFVTPYQVNDQRRPWIRKEEKIFSESLRKMNASIEREVLYADHQRTIELHFKLLEDFKPISEV